jgi:hypothetical protein
MRSLSICLFLTLTLSAQDAPRRVIPTDGPQRAALVIGNNAYPRMPLTNAVNDARSIATALGDAGFKVKLAENADSHAIEQAVQAFAGTVQPGDVALFYYSGHGIQVGGENYLVPVNFDAATETDAKYQAFPVSRIGESLQERGARLKIVILDACRDNPFRMSRSGSRGLAAMTTVRGSFIAFATDPGRTADDNPSGGNGLFTKHLIDALRVPGLKIEEVFNRAREGVERDSAGKQVPWTVSSVIGDFYFRPVVATAAPVVTPNPVADQSAEIVFWNTIKDSHDPALYRAYLKKFPDGVFKEIAEVEVAKAAAPVGDRPAASARPPDEVQTFLIHHVHRGTDPEGRLWVGAGKVEFQEHGDGSNPEHNFSATCVQITHAGTEGRADGLGNLRNDAEVKIKIGPKEQDYGFIGNHEVIIGAIKSMCEQVWFQRGGDRKK